MRFEFYNEGLADVPKLSVDGTVGNAVHLSHWQGNETPARLRADTSTEIALNFVAAPDREEIARGARVVTNNHFDTDGVLSVWAVLTGGRALDLRNRLIAAAEAGDFSEFTGAQAVRASITIQGGDNPFVEGVASPLARHLAGGADVDEKRADELVLPEVERVTLGGLVERLNGLEPEGRGRWRTDGTELTSAVKFLDAAERPAASRLEPDAVAAELRGVLLRQRARAHKAKS